MYYKLTDQKMQTYNGFQWQIGEWQEAKGSIEKGLCSNAWLHCYDSSLLAVLHNPIHANIKEPRLFEVEVSGEMKNDRGVKRGFRRMQIVKEISLPKIIKNQKIAYSLLCAKEVYKDRKWNKWADNWLSGKDRSRNAADAAYVANAAANAANAAANAANVAANAAYAGANAAYAAYAGANAAYAAYAGANAAYAAYVANAAADAANAAADAAYAVLNLVELAEKAVAKY